MVDVEADTELAALVRDQRRAAHLGNAGRESGLDPFDAAALSSSAAGAVQKLQPGSVALRDPLALLDTVKDGRVTLEVPLKEGSHRFGGHEVTVKPGTRARVELEVKDGKIVPRGEGRGGTSVSVSPPLDGPLWITGKGAYVERDGGPAKNQGKLMADLGGFFDLKVKKVDDLGLGAAVRQLTGTPEEASGATGAQKPKKRGDNGAADLLDTSRLRFEVANVRLAGDAVDLGNAKLDLGPGSELSLSGTGQRAELKGRVRVDALSVQQEGLTLDAARGKADLSLTLAQRPAGDFDVRARVTGLEADVRRLEAKADGAGGDRLALGDASLRDGAVDVRMRVGADGAALSQVSAKGRFKGRAEGRLTVKDAEDDARLSFSTGRAEASFEVDGARARVDGKLEGAQLEVTGLDADNGAASLKLDHARARGDVSLFVDTGTKSLSAEVRATDVDVAIADYRGKSEGVAADLGRTEVKGDGTLRLGSDGGLSVEGDLRVKGVVDDLKVDGEQGAPARFDVARGSTLEGRLRKLSVREGLELDASASVNLALEGYEVKLPGVEAKGTATLRGSADVKVGDGAVRIDGHTTAHVAIDEARVAPGGDALSLDVARGSELTLALKQASYSHGPGGVQLKLGAESHLEATLGGGHVKVGDYEAQLDKGSRARLDIQELSRGPGGAPALKGRLEIDVGAAVEGGDASRPGGVGVDADARAKVVLDDVTLGQDGRLSAKSAEVSLDARIDRITAATKGVPAIGARKPQRPAASASASSSAAAAASGASVPSPDGVLSREQVRATSASELAGVTPASGSFDPLALAKQVRDGRLELSLPLEGKVGDGLKSVRFEPGTRLKLTAEVTDGRIVRDQLKAEINKPGDGPLWVTVRGAYLDDKDRLRLDLGGMRDLSVADLSGDGPPTVSRLVDRLGAKALAPAGGGRASARGASASSPIDLSRAEVRLEGARFQDGTLELPFGSLTVDGDTRLSLEGSAQRAVLSGRVNVERLDVRGEELALKGARGDADLRVEIDRTGAAPRAAATLSDLELSVEEVAFKRGGDYLHLGGVRLKGGELRVAGSLEGGAPRVSATVRLPEVEAEIRSGRLFGDDAKAGEVELGRTRFSGAIDVGEAGVERVSGRVEELDAGVKGVVVTTPEGSVSLDGLRVRGSAGVELSKGGIALTRGDVALEALADRAQLAPLGLPVEQISGEGSASARLRLSGFERIAVEPAGEMDGQPRAQLTVEGGRFEAKARVSELRGRFLVP